MTAEIPKQPGRVPVGELRAIVREMEHAAEAGRLKGNEEGANVIESYSDDLKAVIERYE